MIIHMKDWTQRSPVEPGPTYFTFSGTCYLTPTAREKLTDEDLDAILTDLLNYIFVYEGVEKRQRSQCGKGRSVYLEDCLDRASARFLAPHRNYFIISLIEDQSLVRKSRFTPHRSLIEYEVKAECRPSEELRY